MPDQERMDIRGQAEAYVRQGSAKLEQKNYCGAITDYDLRAPSISTLATLKLTVSAVLLTAYWVTNPEPRRITTVQ